MNWFLVIIIMEKMQLRHELWNDLDWCLWGPLYMYSHVYVLVSTFVVGG